MTPAQFLGRVKRGEIPPVCLFLGQEGYNRTRCRQALIAASPSPIERFDAAETNFAAILDDARAMSLFSAERLMFVGNAEAAMPRGRAAAAAAAEEVSDDSDEGSGAVAAKNADLLTAYVKDPTPGVTLVVEASRWDFEGEDKPKNERVRKFFAAITEVVEFRCFDAAAARSELDRIAKTLKLQIEPAAAEALVEALAADVNRISVELEKLALYGKPITAAELPLLVPDARESTILVLVNALGRRDRSGALGALDALVREGEYLPLALSFLATQFRMALVAKESNLKGAGQVQGHFQRMGVNMWGSRADQVWLTASKFTKAQMERGLKLIFEADRDLRSARPDDRIVMENFVMKLCA
ncbi:MAG: polymerase delta subunit [Bryobacterales bacterium]|nr:polymerase delta subunit [Bryobacterales bacterium]